MEQVFKNGRFYSLGRLGVRCYEAIVVRDGVIQYLGSLDSINPGLGAETIDLGGRMVVPSFTDSHIHFLTFGLSLGSVRLDGLSRAAALEAVAEAHEQCRAGEWVTGRGFNFNLWGDDWPTKGWLDEWAPMSPVVLTAKDGHMIWVNSAALKACGITNETATPLGGEITRDIHGEPTGLLKETAMELVLRHIPEPPLDRCVEAVRLAVAECTAHGITAVHNMEGSLAWRALQEAESRNGPMDFRVWLTAGAENLDNALALGLKTGFGSERMRFGGIKVFADGALGSRTAAMLKPYEGTENHGLTVTDANEMHRIVAQANGGGIPVAVHAIGDAANRWVLDAIESCGDRSLRNRIEHAQLLSPQDINRFESLGVTASVQPTHCPQDRYMADVHWGKRSRFAYAFRSLLDSGASVAFGSDCPVETCSVLTALYSAVFRRRIDEPDTDSWYPVERITVAEALRAYSVGGAYAAGEELWRGNLLPGMPADFTVLSENILERPELIPDTHVDSVYFSGRQVFQRSA